MKEKRSVDCRHEEARRRTQAGSPGRAYRTAVSVRAANSLTAGDGGSEPRVYRAPRRRRGRRIRSGTWSIPAPTNRRCRGSIWYRTTRRGQMSSASSPGRAGKRLGRQIASLPPKAAACFRLARQTQVQEFRRPVRREPTWAPTTSTTTFQRSNGLHPTAKTSGSSARPSNPLTGTPRAAEGVATLLAGRIRSTCGSWERTVERRLHVGARHAVVPDASQTMEVTRLDDSHDEGEETPTLSNASAGPTDGGRGH